MNQLLVIIVLIATTLMTILSIMPPKPLPIYTPAAEFSTERAIEHIRVIAAEPHPVGSAANAAVREYILQQLSDLGLETDTQKAGELVNVLGRIEGTQSKDAVMLSAHLDSVAESPGATDDGSGVAALLETARALSVDGSLPNTVLFLFTDDEESGLVGAKAFIENHPWAKDVRVVIGLDAGGLSGPGVLSTTSPNNGWLIQQVVQADRSLVGSSVINLFADSGTDFGHAFKPAGFSGYAFDLYWDRRIHTPADSIENINPSSIQHQGMHALSMARHFAKLDSLVDPKAPDAVYFNLLNIWTVTYPSALAIPFAIGVGVFFLIVLGYGFARRILSWRGIGYGAFTALVGIILAPMPGIIIGNLSGKWDSDMPLRFVGRALGQPLQILITVLISIGVMVVWYSLSPRFRRTGVKNLAVGALGLMFVAMVGSAIVFPTLSFIFTWPLLIYSVASAIWLIIPRSEGISRVAGLSLLLAAISSIILLGPTILLGLFDQLTFTLLLLGVLLSFQAPMIYYLLGISMGDK